MSELTGMGGERAEQITIGLGLPVKDDFWIRQADLVLERSARLFGTRLEERGLGSETGSAFRQPPAGFPLGAPNVEVERIELARDGHRRVHLTRRRVGEEGEDHGHEVPFVGVEFGPIVGIATQIHLTRHPERRQRALVPFPRALMTNGKEVGALLLG